MAEQFTFTNGPFDRSLHLWMASAISSLPVPVSPWMNTVAPVGATTRTVARPQGVPWPSPEQASIYRIFLPANYRRIAEPFGGVGMIETECSPWVEDNYWVLEENCLILGSVTISCYE